MKIEIPEIRVIKGDIELSDTIAADDYSDLLQVFTKCKNRPTVRLTLWSPCGHFSFEFKNWTEQE